MLEQGTVPLFCKKLNLNLDLHFLILHRNRNFIILECLFAVSKILNFFFNNYLIEHFYLKSKCHSKFQVSMFFSITQKNIFSSSKPQVISCTNVNYSL